MSFIGNKYVEASEYIGGLIADYIDDGRLPNKAEIVAAAENSPACMYVTGLCGEIYDEEIGDNSRMQEFDAFCAKMEARHEDEEGEEEE